jgi:hypothetical protein
VARVSLVVPRSLPASTRRLVACVGPPRGLRCGRAVVLRIRPPAPVAPPPAAQLPAPPPPPVAPDPPAPAPGTVAGVPVPAVFSVTIQGAAGAGSGLAPFAQTAALVLAPTLDPTAATGNGANPVDVGIRTAGSPIVGVAGALWFGTNLGVSAIIGSSPAVGPAAVDIAFVAVANGRIEVVLDGNVFGLPFARVNYLNIFNVQTSVVAQIHNLLGGRIVVEVLEGGRAVSGTIELAGSAGFGGPAASSAYTATFTGVRAA